MPLLLALVALPGCGGSDDDKGSTSTAAPAVQGDQRAVLETIDELQIASRSGNGGRVCSEIFTKSLVRSIEASSKRSCAAEVREKLFTPDASFAVQRGIRVTGATASAVVRDQVGNVSTLHFRKQAGSTPEEAARWRIDRVTPQKASQP